MKKQHFLIGIAISLFISAIFLTFYCIWINTRYGLTPRIWIGSFFVHFLIILTGCFILWVPAGNLWSEEELDEKVVARSRIAFGVSVGLILGLLGWAAWDMIVGVSRREETLWQRVSSGGIIDIIQGGFVFRLIKTGSLDLVTPIPLFLVAFCLVSMFIIIFLLKMMWAMQKEGLYQSDLFLDA